MCKLCAVLRRRKGESEEGSHEEKNLTLWPWY